MNTDRYLKDMDARRTTFWRGGDESHAVKGYTTPKFEPALEHYEDEEPSDDKRFDDADGVIYED